MKTVFYVVKEDSYGFGDKAFFETATPVSEQNGCYLAEEAAQDYLNDVGGDMVDPTNWPVTIYIFANENDTKPLYEGEVEMWYEPVFRASED